MANITITVTTTPTEDKIEALLAAAKQTKEYADAAYEHAEAAYEHALELAEEEVDVLNNGCDELVSFGVVEDEDKDCIRVLCYILDGPEDTTGETEQVTTYWVEEVEGAK